jgi:hypothetical protein
MKSEPGAPMTLGNAESARVRPIVLVKACRHQVEPGPAEMAQPMPLDDWWRRGPFTMTPWNCLGSFKLRRQAL